MTALTAKPKPQRRSAKISGPPSVSGSSPSSPVAPGDHLALEQQAITSDLGFLAWFEAYAYIRDKSRRLIQPEANPFQVRCGQTIAYCLRHGIPIRLLKLKPRQKGCSTVSVAELYWLMRRQAMNAVIIGGEYSQVNNLWEILKLYQTKDSFPWPGGGGMVQERSGMWDIGSAVQKETARDAEAGRSGTFQGLIATEAARWKERGVANATAVITGILNCIPYQPGTIAILESTAAGDSGMFYDYWQDAITIEDHAAGNIPSTWNGYFRIFSPWYEHKDSEDRLTQREADRIVGTYTADEREMVATYHLRPGQITWYRRTMASECKRDPAIMKREYPGSPEEAFHAASRRRFNGAGLQILRNEADQAKYTCGVFTPTTDDPETADFVLHPTEPEHAIAHIYEPPRVGHRYLMGVDIATGISNTDADDPDHHSAHVIRDGFIDTLTGAWRKPAVVASLVKPCRWDIDILAHWVFALHAYYGRCKIIPEANNDRGLIVLLKGRGANLYQRHTDDEQPAGAKAPKPSGKYGFQTTGGNAENTRNWIIENLARHIREWDTDGSGLYCPDIETVKELASFVVNPKTGRAEASEGRKDDRVMALAIGMALLPMATPYAPKPGQRSIPYDIAAAHAGTRPGGGRSGAEFS